MSTTRNVALNDKVGAAICDNECTLMIQSARGRARRNTAFINPNRSLDVEIIRIITGQLNFTPPVVAVSHHDPSVRPINSNGLHVVTVSPTAATLEGIFISPNPSRTVLRPGNATNGTAGLVKIGPHHVTWAKAGDRQGRPIDPDVITEFSQLSVEFTQFVGRKAKNPVELLGNLGWVNAARFFAEVEPNIAPDPRTLRFLEIRSDDREHRRATRSHLGWMANHGDPFGTLVASFMIGQIGRTVGYVAKQANFRTVHLQCNAISGVPPMLNWVQGPIGYKIFSEAITKHDHSRHTSRPTIILTECRPQVPEALGAIKLAGQLVGVA
ncbi:MAG: hypothetical protein NVSMB39_0990 [Candidatus Saccharimonadales bacterium]